MESISRISSMLETARDLTLEAARDASYIRKTSTRVLPATQLKKLLDSRSDRDVLEGLRKVITMTYRSQPTLPYFSSVIKNIASPNLEIKKLVYIYLLQHAEAEPDTALLSINTIQKSLTDSNPQVRALALRVMSGIRVPVISQIVSLGIKRGAGDMSPYVRRAAALAIPKCYSLDPSTLPQLLEYLSMLLGDKQYFVAGAAVAAFLEVCPERIDLIHPHYRSLIRKLVDMDEWGQLATLRLMMIYARKCFPRRMQRARKTSSYINTSTATKTTKGFYDSDSDSDPRSLKENTEEIVVLDPDLELLLKVCMPLLQSRNSAVVIAVARCYLYLGTPTYLDSATGPLIALLRSAVDIQYIALYNIVQVCLVRPEPFVAHYTHFLVRSTDASFIWRLKLEVLTLLFPYAPQRLQSLILAELSHFSRSGSQDPGLVREAVRAIGLCAQSSATSPRTSARCLRLLLAHIGSADSRLVAESLEVIRHLIQRDPGAHRTTVVRLAKHLDVATSAQARASIIWLVGEFAGINPENNIATDVLRILAKGFSEEAEAAKLQILLLATKVYVHYLNALPSHPPAQPKALPSLLAGFEDEDGGFRDPMPLTDAPTVEHEAEKQDPIPALYHYILLLTRYDTSYDLRDRARVYRALLATSSTQLASLLLLAPKPMPQTPSPSESRKGYILGSASLVVGDEGGVGGLRGYEDLPPWVEDGKEPDARSRDEVGGGGRDYESGRKETASEKLDSAVGTSKAINTRLASKSTNGVKEKSLDDWLAEDEEQSEESGEEETEEEESTEEETESEESEDEGEGDRLVR
ncbi:hypothetical protein K432DRAFT_429075 [Lepidopterella palustris CBS 459.81]|uniref:Clathrin/coatomer adaptor adaptin-like N-terminal domain-containing protein n=1 Tax=Lepidopterella palustris CBS 459.81 TaxID=1314670 RepID=A0A8E2E206_9PEZI|nr:hypothetical protein K432DRAFT_429075 [Lepidopterella palustris CBS 459.81]